MKAFRIIVSVIVVLAIIILGGSYFLPKNSIVERSIMIGANDSTVYSYVTDFSKFNEWSPWYEMEPTAKTEVSGNLGEVGASYAWEGEELGKGDFKITKLEPYIAVYEKLTFYTPFEAEAENNLFFKQVGDSTKVTWIYNGVNKGVFDKWMGLAMDKMMGKDWERGLNKMKANLEKE
jgi:hypothetical protein